ncbi:MAG: hypothetical protein WCO94_15560, partial [Verrucomicrobiota bacterium]
MKPPKTTGTTQAKNLVTTSGGTEDNRQAVCDELNAEFEQREKKISSSSEPEKQEWVKIGFHCPGLSIGFEGTPQQARNLCALVLMEAEKASVYLSNVRDDGSPLAFGADPAAA